MAAFQTLLQRFGYVKLNSYGLVLTPDGRILSMRHAVLDDGIGGRIVGWRDGDLAAAELGRWEPAKPLTNPVASVAPYVPMTIVREHVRPIAVPPPVPTRITSPTPAMTTTTATAAMSAMSATPTVSIVSPIVVAQTAEEPEDDWEWTIALARARAAEADVRPMMRAAPTKHAPISVVPPPLAPITEPMAATSAPPTERMVPPAQKVVSLPSKPFPRTARTMGTVTPISAKRAITASPIGVPVRARSETMQPSVTGLGGTQPLPSVVAPRASSPKTIIPIPKLPAASAGFRFEPVVRTSTVMAAVPPPRRMPKGTGPVINREASFDVGDQTQTQLELADETRPNLPLPPVMRSAARAR